MRFITRLYLFLLVAALLSGCAVSFTESDNLDSEDVKNLIAKAKKAYDTNDNDLESLLDALFVKVTGLTDTSGVKPNDMDGIEFETRLCSYWKITAPFFKPEELEYPRHEMRFAGLGIVEFDGDISPEMRVRLDCGKDEGQQVPLSRALEDGIAWAKKLKRASPSEARAMAAEYDVLYKQQPKLKLYGLLRELALINAERREKQQAD